MKVYIVTIDDIEDSYPEKAFDTREKAEAYWEHEFQKEKKLYDDLPPHPKAMDFVFTKENYYSLIVELDVE